MNKEQYKQAVAEAALHYIQPHMVLGIGTGSTVNYFISALAQLKVPIKGVISSSNASTERLHSLAFPVYPVNAVDHVDLYIDGADEVDCHKQLIKGGGAALTGEKIVAAVAKQFICIIDETKLVERLGTFPLPIEVIPMAQRYITKELMKLGGSPIYRHGVRSDYGHAILDIHHLPIADAVALETRLNQLPGVVTVGLFAHRPADKILVATATQGIYVID